MASRTSTLLDELSLYLRPPGRGIHAVSTGLREAEAFTAKYLRGSRDLGRSWRQHLEGVVELKGKNAVAILAIPPDTGAGISRGAAHGPEGIRARWSSAPAFELGDVFSVPQLMDDEMHSASLLTRARKAVFASAPPSMRAKVSRLPVSPLSMAERVYTILRQLNPELRVLLLGGDHTVTWPALAAILGEGKAKNKDVGIVHFDAHTDLLQERLGVRYCFATWAYHANELLGRGQRLVQLGIRASGHGRAYWESSLGVK
ncbi:MAG TPA: arginase family protein, partial [Bdellovibrionota bacterium]|nr:arginase family protein [Bdellovibrionota bacterium]